MRQIYYPFFQPFTWPTLWTLALPAILIITFPCSRQIYEPQPGVFIWERIGYAQIHVHAERKITTHQRDCQNSEDRQWTATEATALPASGNLAA
ncbi:hypothetical protein BDR22DRAFT_413467 [Usnea florida]